MITIILSCVGRRGYIAHYFREALGSEGRLLGTSNTAWTPGFSACDESIILPAVRSADYAGKVIALCREEKADAILSLFDPDIDVLSAHLAYLRSGGTLPLICSHDTSQICFDKMRMNAFLGHEGFPIVPMFTSAKEASLAVESGQIRLPLVMKERCGFGSRRLTIVPTREHLITLHSEEDVIFQELVAGDEYGLDILNDLSGRALAVVPKRKIAMRAGETDQAVTVEDPTLENLGLRLGGLLGHPGPTDVDVILREGIPYVLDINPRFGGGYPAAHMAGADFPRLIVEMIRGRQIASPRHHRPGVTMMKSVVPIPGPPSSDGGR